MAKELDTLLSESPANDLDGTEIFHAYQNQGSPLPSPPDYLSVGVLLSQVLAYCQANISGGGVTTPNTITDNYTLADGDEARWVLLNAATAKTVTVPLDSTHDFDVGTEIPLAQLGAGQLMVEYESGVTVVCAEDYAARKQGSAIGLLKTGADAWLLTGDLQLLSA